MAMYGNVAGLAQYCADRAYDISAHDAAAQSAALTKASTFVDGLGYKDTGTGVRTSFWPGTPADGAQILEWPRVNAADIYGNEIGDSMIPARIENATYEVAFFTLGGGDINRALSADQVVTREKFDVIEFQYADAGGKTPDTRPVLPAVMDLLAPLLTGGSGNPYGLTLVVSG